MINFFVSIVFIAELIIAVSLILKIYRFNKAINSLNLVVTKSQQRIKVAFFDFRFLCEEFNSAVYLLRKHIKEKKEEYTLKFIKNILIWLSFLSLKTKYKKAVLAYQFLKDVYEGYKEA